MQSDSKISKVTAPETASLISVITWTKVSKKRRMRKRLSLRWGPSEEQRSKTTLKFEVKRTTNWSFVSEIEIIMISNCETIDHSGKECHHIASRKLLIAINREKHLCSDACEENKDYRKAEIEWRAHQEFQKTGGKSEHIEKLNTGVNAQNWKEAKPMRTKDSHPLSKYSIINHEILLSVSHIS